MPAARFTIRALSLAALLLSLAGAASAGGNACRAMQCESDPAALAQPSKYPAPGAPSARAGATAPAPVSPAPPEHGRHKATTPPRVLSARPTARGKTQTKSLPATPSLSTVLRMSTGSGDEVSFLDDRPAIDERLLWLEGRGPPRAGPPSNLLPLPARRARSSAELLAGPDPTTSRFDSTPDLRDDLRSSAAGPFAVRSNPTGSDSRALRPEDAGACIYSSSGGLSP